MAVREKGAEKKEGWGRKPEKRKRAFLSPSSGFAFWMGLEVNRGRKTPNSRPFFSPFCQKCKIYKITTINHK